MPNQPGVTTTIDYVDDAGNKRRAWLGETDIHNWHVPLLERADDPEWHIHLTETGENVKREKLYYANPAGNYRVKVTGAPFDGPKRIVCTFQHEALDKDDNHSDDLMDFKDWDGSWWRASIVPVTGSFPGQPSFRLERLILG